MGLNTMYSRLRRTAEEFVADNCATFAAALAYYTVFSLPPLLFIVIVLAGFFFGRETVQTEIQKQAQVIMGGTASVQVGMIASTAARTTVMPQSADGAISVGSVFGFVISVAGLIVGATTAFVQLQEALNRSWKIRSKSGGIREFIAKRVLSFVILMLLAALVLASSALNAWALAAGTVFGVPWWTIDAMTFAVSFLLFVALFAVIFKYFPDVEIAWSDVRVGAFMTAALFEIGRFLLGVYLGKTATASMYGAAGSLALVLLFIYYAAMIVLFGAEFTQVWARSNGDTPRPFRRA